MLYGPKSLRYLLELKSYNEKTVTDYGLDVIVIVTPQ